MAGAKLLAIPLLLAAGYYAGYAVDKQRPRSLAAAAAAQVQETATESKQLPTVEELEKMAKLREHISHGAGRLSGKLPQLKERLAQIRNQEALLLEEDKALVQIAQAEVRAQPEKQKAFKKLVELSPEVDKLLRQ